MYKKRMFSVSAILLISFMLFGCAIRAAREEMEMSKAAYKKCLEQHPDDLSKCEALKKAYEADLKAFRAMSATISGSRAVTIEE